MNPLLSREFRIPFHEISPEQIVPGIEEAVRRAEAELAALTAAREERTYDDTVAALDELTERLDRAVTIAYHLNAVNGTPEMRAAFQQALPSFSAFYARLPGNRELWHALKQYAATPEARALTGIRARRLEKLLLEFRRDGADLPEAERERVEAIRVELATLHTKFGENVLEGTNAYELVIEDERDLAGLPESALSRARADARAAGVAGWRFTLHQPSFQPFMQYAENRELRRRMLEAYHRRGAGEGRDNRPLMRRILELRREAALLLGYPDFADYRLEVNMVGSGAAATRFVSELREATEPHWRREMAELEAFARERLGYDRLEPWDVAFATERLRRERFDLDAEQLRPYFPLERVLEGLFEITGRLFGITVTETPNDRVWHEEVRYYEIHDESGTHLGSFYTDWHPRSTKRAGAWMNSFITGGPRPDGGFDPHLGLMVGNLTPPDGDRPALLTHREVQTIFHEFGHLLHHCLSRVEVPALAGTSVPRDWVELPSQILENWTWEREALDLFARHYETGEPVPAELLDRMERARTFMEATAQMRQLSFGAVDLAFHTDYDPAGDEEAIAFGRRVMAGFAPQPEFAENDFLTAFSHVFTGGYAAGYYSYKWSEVLDADAFSRFREAGIFDPATGRDFKEAVLSRGYDTEPEELFREFMGRDPRVGALLERNLGLTGAMPAD